MNALASLAKRALKIHERLLKFYVGPTWRNPLPAIDELVSTILSQNTNDINRDRAYDALCQGDLIALESCWKWRTGLLGKPVVIEAHDGIHNGRLLEQSFDAVAIELCGSRHQSLDNPDAMAGQDLFEIFRQGKAGMVAASLALGAFQQRVAEQSGIEPGAEMRAALEETRRADLPLMPRAHPRDPPRQHRLREPAEDRPRLRHRGRGPRALVQRHPQGGGHPGPRVPDAHLRPPAEHGRDPEPARRRGRRRATARRERPMHRQP